MLLSTSQMCAENMPLGEVMKIAVQPLRPMSAEAYCFVGSYGCQTYLEGSGEMSSVYLFLRSWMTNSPGLVVGMSKKRLSSTEGSRKRLAGSKWTVELPVEQNWGHSSGEHGVRSSSRSVSACRPMIPRGSFLVKVGIESPR